MPQSKQHKLDLENPLVAMQYLGDPVEQFISLAESDGWTIDRHGDCRLPPTNLRERLGIVTMMVRYDEISVRSKNGRIVAIGPSAYVSQ